MRQGFGVVYLGRDTEGLKTSKGHVDGLAMREGPLATGSAEGANGGVPQGPGEQRMDLPHVAKLQGGRNPAVPFPSTPHHRETQWKQ